MNRRDPLRFVLKIVLIAAGGLPIAWAADPKPVPARPKAASAVMSKEELRQCLDQKESVRVETENLDKSRTALANAKVTIEKRSTELSERFVVLDRTSASAVDAHNADVAEREKSVDAFQRQVEGFNANVVSVREHQQAFEKACGNKLYEVRDENAIRKAK